MPSAARLSSSFHPRSVQSPSESSSSLVFRGLSLPAPQDFEPVDHHRWKGPLLRGLIPRLEGPHHLLSPNQIGVNRIVDDAPRSLVATLIFRHGALSYPHEIISRYVPPTLVLVESLDLPSSWRNGPSWQSLVRDLRSCISSSLLEKVTDSAMAIPTERLGDLPPRLQGQGGDRSGGSSVCAEAGSGGGVASSFIVGTVAQPFARTFCDVQPWRRLHPWVAHTGSIARADQHQHH